MKTYILRALVIAFVMGALGGLALTPSSVVRAQDDEPGAVPVNTQKEAREAYSKAYEEAQAAEQDKQNQDDEEDKGGCCG